MKGDGVLARKLLNIQESAVSAARKLINENGIDGVTIRGVASMCSIAVGTMYNYFPSKEYLIGCVVLEDWKLTYSEMDKHSEEGKSVLESIGLIYEDMRSFSGAHTYLYSFHNWDTSGKYTHSSRHEELLREIGIVVDKALSSHNLNPGEDIALFICESIINSAVKGYSFKDIEPAFKKLLS